MTARMTAVLPLLAMLAGVISSGMARATNAQDLYVSDAIVTGTGEENREIGFRECLEEVLVKVSGDQRVLAAPALAPLIERAGSFVASFAYRDRLEGIPIHDEQGTHDRPHDLTCRYEPATIDRLLDELGSRPWPQARPRIAVFLAVHDQKRSFMLTSDGEESPYMAESLAAATVPLALEARLPDRKTLTQEKLGLDFLSSERALQLERLAKAIGADVALVGTISWNDEALGWIADWQLTEDAGKRYRWQIRGVSFDDAFRNAIRGAAQILSGNGAP
ncbi:MULTISPECIES: DUF2066 domain-containing protein [unclassified Sinorhizobium]|uniref:DUF2066 domain-containing protein n=1 Tax=unclassified Sinorhizobium TaxID=2613772 RepID=UPI0024C3DAF6|nr:MULTISPECIES: DUF2066 domain-containing protein [unclassified Sinorhizobium]MDK1374999.1 DUF2066 domain-containing protein [Sinorhizobium sp. 6-70]MDK1482476.1 DUF2066 domain-containing protein [Sinorhizobium sp. 6-117]